MSSSSSASVRSQFSTGDGALLVLLASMWGFSFLFIKVAVEHITPLWVVAGRTLIGGIALYVFLHARGARLPRSASLWGHLAVLGVLSNVLPWGMVAWAEQFIPSGLSSVLNTLIPVTTLAIAAAIGLERLTGRKVAGLLLAVVGTLVVIGGEFGAPDRALAIAVNIAATFFFAGGAVYAKRFVSGRVRPLEVATGQVLVGFAAALPAAWLVGPTPEWGRLPFEVIGSIGALGFFGTGLAFLVFYALVERVGATNTTLVTYLIPVVGLLAGALVLGESFGWNVFAGGAVIVAGIWLAQREAPAPVRGEGQPVVTDDAGDAPTPAAGRRRAG